MKLYTKRGDKGMTSIIGGQKVRKNSVRVSSYGAVDELNSYIGIIISEMTYYSEIKKQLENIQQYLFDCGTDLATPNASRGYRMTDEATLWLEDKIDKYADVPPALKEFILPGGSQIAARLHYCRTIARRVEREVVALQEVDEINDEVVKFLNRLSDYFYAIARFINFRDGREDVKYRRDKKIFH